MSRSTAAVLLLITVTVLAVSGAVAATEGHPTLAVHLPDNRVAPGEEATLEFYLLNDGSITEEGPEDEEAAVTTARNVTMAVERGSAPISVQTATRPVGTVPEGRVGPLPVQITVNRSAEPGRYAVPVTVAYTFTSELDRTDPADPDRETERQTTEHTVSLVVEARARFGVVETTTDASAGETGAITVTLENTGSATARDAVVTLRSDDSALTFGERQTVQAYVGDWAQDERRSVTVEGGFGPGADDRTVPVVATVEFLDDRDRVHTSDRIVAGVTPGVEPTFAVENVSGMLAVGDEGTLSGTVTNQGPSPVRNAVLVLSTENANLAPAETEFAIGDLEPGAPAPFAFAIDVSEAAEPGPRLVSIEVRYRDAGNDVRRSDPIDTRVTVGPRRPVFDVEPVTTRLAAGESIHLELRVANAGAAPVTDVTAKLFPDDPLTSSDDEAFIDRLEPGESVSVRFALAAAPSALDKRYPVSLDFQYDDADGDTHLSDTYRIPVEVTAPTDGDGLGPVVLVVALLGVLGVAGGLWYARRR